jgi:Uma2 family endonuclease
MATRILRETRGIFQGTIFAMCDRGCNMARVKVVQPRVSYADLERAPEDGRRYELYDGEVFVVPAPLPRHQVSRQLVLDVLRRYAAHQGGFAVSAPIDIVFSDYDVLQPDVVFFRRERQHLIDLDAPIRHAPDLCVEILSPSTAATDRGRKMQMFARYGVPEYWIVDPLARTVEVHYLVNAAYIVTSVARDRDVIVSPTIDGLKFGAAAVFVD